MGVVTFFHMFMLYLSDDLYPRDANLQKGVTVM